jgi:hypothetical protein
MVRVINPAQRDAPLPTLQPQRRVKANQPIHLVQVAMTAGPFMTDHLFLSAATTVKQLGLPPFQVVQ